MVEPIVKDMVVDVLEEYEPWIKQQFDEITTKIYDYLLSRTDVLDLSIDLREFKSTLKDNLWVILNEKAESLLPDFIDRDLKRFIGDNVVQYRHFIPADLLPPDADQLSDEELTLFLAEHLDFVEEQLGTVDTGDIITGLTEEIVRPYFDQLTDDFITEIPDTFVVDDEVLGPDGLRTLEEVRRYLGYFNASFYGLIALIVVLVGLVWLIYRDVKHSSLALGITLALFGFLQLASSIVARSIDPFRYVQDVQEIPLFLEDMVMATYRDALTPMLWFNSIVLAIGVGLIVLSILSKPKAVED